MTATTASRGRRPGPHRWRPGPILTASLAVVAIIAVRWLGDIAAVGSAGSSLDLGAPAGLAALVSAVFPEATCTTGSEADSQLRVRLDAAGYDDWAVTSTDVRTSRGCVGATIDASNKTINLVPALRPEVKAALSVVTEHLFDSCLGKEAATAYLTSVLSHLYETGFQIATNGPVGFPISRASEVQQHLDDGCWIYSGTGVTAGGQRVYYLSGR